jgi:hypothetical protein
MRARGLKPVGVPNAAVHPLSGLDLEDGCPERAWEHEKLGVIYKKVGTVFFTEDEEMG